MTVRNKLLTAEQSLYPHKEHKGAVILLFCAAMKTVRTVLLVWFQRSVYFSMT